MMSYIYGIKFITFTARGNSAVNTTIMLTVKYCFNWLVISFPLRGKLYLVLHIPRKAVRFEEIKT